MKLKRAFDLFVWFVVFVKIIFVLTTLLHFVSLRASSSHVVVKKISPKLARVKTVSEFMFTICMAIILLCHFNPYHRVPLTYESSLLMYLFGFILVLTAKWSEVF